MPGNSLSGQCDGGRFSTADAQSRYPAFEVETFERMSKRYDEPTARRPDWVTLSASSTVDVHLRGVEFEFLDRQHRDHGKSFVDLKQIDVIYRPTDDVQKFANRTNRRRREFA